MNLTALETFLSVVRNGNLNRAAAQLNVTQSTVTARLDALEAALGQRLLLRSRKGAVMTKAGFAFQRHAETILQSWDLARRSVDLAEGYSGLLSLACEAGLWTGLGDRWLARLRCDLPAAALEAWPGTIDEIGRWLASGLVDAALTQEPLSGRGFGSRLVQRDRILLVATDQPSQTSWEAGYLHVDYGPEFRRWYAQHWPSHRMAALVFGSVDWALAQLSSDGGAAYLPERLLRSRGKANAFHPIAGAPAFVQSIYLAARQDERLSGAEVDLGAVFAALSDEGDRDGRDGRHLWPQLA